MDKIKKFFRDNLLGLVIIVITSVFTSGATYSSVKADIQNNKDMIEAVSKTVDTNKADLGARLDRIENKIDNMNSYLLQEGNVRKQQYSDYQKDRSEFLHMLTSYQSKTGIK